MTIESEKFKALHLKSSTDWKPNRYFKPTDYLNSSLNYNLKSKEQSPIPTTSRRKEKRTSYPAVCFLKVFNELKKAFCH